MFNDDCVATIFCFLGIVRGAITESQINQHDKKRDAKRDQPMLNGGNGIGDSCQSDIF